MNEGIQEYFDLINKRSELKKQEKELKTRITTLEKEIKAYMQENQMDSISLKEGQIILYERKISQTFKKDTLIERLTETLNDSNKAEELTQSILTNKKFVTEDKIRAVMKNKK